MIESLRIKCPACGIVLDVRNSKNEAVKRIVCPNCKKQIAVDFREEPTPKPEAQSTVAFYYGAMRLPLQEGDNQIPLPGSEHIAVTLVRLNNGGCKCVVKALTAEHIILVNGQPLEQGDEIVLTDGDELRIGNAVLTYNKMGQPTASVSVPQTKPEPAPKPQKKQFNWWPYAAGVFSFLLVVFLLWPAKKDGQKQYVKKSTDTVLPIKKNLSSEPVKPPKTIKVKDAIKETTVDYSKMKDYELELRAGKSDVKAQYELGRRWVNKKDSVNIVKGVSYLKQAANGGSSEAGNSLRKLYQSLEQSANNGNSHARNLLEVIK